MTDAPERIWAWVAYDGNWDGTWLADSVHLEPHGLPDAAYIRADSYLVAKKDAALLAAEELLQAVEGDTWQNTETWAAIVKLRAAMEADQ